MMYEDFLPMSHRVVFAQDTAQRPRWEGLVFDGLVRQEGTTFSLVFLLGRFDLTQRVHIKWFFLGIFYTLGFKVYRIVSPHPKVYCICSIKTGGWLNRMYRVSFWPETEVRKIPYYTYPLGLRFTRYLIFGPFFQTSAPH